MATKLTADQVAALNTLLSTGGMPLTTSDPVYATVDGKTVKITKAADGSISVASA